MADDIDEIGSSSLCRCGKKSTFNARKVNDKFIQEGSDILIDESEDNVTYVPLCGDCYLKYLKLKDEKAKKLSSIVKKIS